MKFGDVKVSVGGVEVTGFDADEVEFYRPGDSQFRLVYLKRGVRLQPGDLIFESMIERRRWVIALHRAVCAMRVAWVRLRMWRKPR